MSSSTDFGRLDTSWNLTYRPDIDGLRTIAVGSVFFFHLNPSWLPGGFVGVDIFFVISGFLITHILMKDVQRGSGGLADFYQRRIARLFPAMLTVVTSTLLMAWLIYSPQDFASAGANAIAALVSLANIKFFLQGEYFEMSRDAQPFLHFWSLSVEEQYYLIYPLVLMYISRYRVGAIGPTILLISLLSFSVCIVFTFTYPSAAFYLLPFRAWELGIGGVAAFIAQGVWGGAWVRFRGAFAMFGFVAITISLVLFHEEMGLPGYAASLPVLGTAALLIAGHNGDYPGRVWLSTSPMVAIGKISYTLYLWHWPVFSFVDYALFWDHEFLRMVLKIVISAVLTLATFFLMEKPLRASLNRTQNRLYAFVGFAAAVAIIIPIGLKIRSYNYVDVSVDQVAAGGLYFPGPAGSPTVVLVGDSNASMYAAMLRDLSKDRGYSLYIASSAAGDALPNPSGENSSLWSASAALIDRIEPDVVVIANAWGAKLGSDRSKLDIALKEILQNTDRIVLLNQAPVLPPGSSREGIRAGARPPFLEEADTKEQRVMINNYISTFASERIFIVDVPLMLLDRQGHIRFTDVHGRLLYQDTTHLSRFGSDKVRPELEEALKLR